MAIEARTLLINEMEKRLSTMLIQADMKNVMSAMSDVLDNFEVSSVECDGLDNDDLLDAYLSAMQVQGRTPKTIERYRYIIGKIMNSVKVPTRSVTVYHLRKYIAQEKERGISESTLEGTRQIMSAYFNWLSRENLIEKNPVANLGAIKCAKKIKKIYTDVDIEKLKFGCKNIRDRAMVMFMLSTGCRVSEMTQLNREDIDFAKMEVKVFGKGKKERTVFFDAVTKELLQEYLASRTDDYEALFVGRGSDRISTEAVRFMLTQLEKATGVEHVHPHKFRRTLATNLIKRGMPIQEVASILGHDKLDTTMQYVVLDETEIKHSYTKYA